MKIEFTATHPIVSTQDEGVTLLLGARAIDLSGRYLGINKRARDGSPFGQVDRKAVPYRLSTVRIYDGPVSPEPGVITVQQFEEFMDSTAGQVPWTWDKYAVTLDDDNPVQAITTSTRYSFSRILRKTRFLRTSFGSELVNW